jgi:subtilisin family serine protease
MHRRSKVAFIAVAGAVSALVAAAGWTSSVVGARASEPTASYIVMMEAATAVAYDGGVPGIPATAPAEGEDFDSDTAAVAAYVAHIEAEQDAVLSEAGIPLSDKGDEFALAINGFEATLTVAEVEALERRPEVAQVVPNELQPLDDYRDKSAGSFLGVQDGNGLWANGVTGKDVVVGIIDSGIWPEHPSFADTGYEPLPGYVGLPCQFGDTAYNPDDAPFTCNNKLLGAYDLRNAYKSAIGAETYNSARDYDGHGTHTASTAAGNRDVWADIFGIPKGYVSGIAPEARVIAYSVCGDLGCFSSDLVAAINQAIDDEVDVINFSIGGGASLAGPDEIAFLLAADAGIWVAASNGNDGPGAATGGGPASAPWITAVGASSWDHTWLAPVRLGNGERYRGSSVTRSSGGAKRFVDGAALGNTVCDPDVDFTAPITNAIVLCERGGGVGRVDKGRAVYEQGGAGVIIYNNNDDMALLTDNHFVPAALVNNSDGLAMRDYINSAGSTARVSIGMNRFSNTQGSVMADFSSRGPNPVAPDIIKPDVTAPGVVILAGNTPTPSGSAPEQLFQAISGTSMSSPQVAGLYALLHQVHPDWSPAMAKSALMTSSRQDVWKEGGTRPADPFDMGAGHVDASGRAGRPGSLLNPGLVYDAGFFDYLGFLCGSTSGVVSAAGCAFVESLGFPTEAYNLNYPSIGASAIAGSITIERTVTSVASGPLTWSADIEAPEGFSVSVDPATFTLAPGASQVVEITITNETALVDEWRFGSLTWTSGRYEVYSPIAASAVSFDAPDVVAGSGVEGTATFPVRFGYTGSYTAAPHGLVPDVTIAGTVLQDPDQEFDPADPTGTTAHAITTAGSAYLRIELATADLTPPNSDTDIDLYLLDAGGRLVAQSTSGSTDELIEVVLPADGTYTLYVHGWQVVGGTVDYTLHTWDVPATPGTGPLTVTSAPASATLGAVGDISVAWSGLTAGVQYYGAVSHSGDDGLLGLTLVNVNA